MCLYPKLIKNPKYLPNKKNGGCPPPLLDKRLEYIPARCGKCYECRKEKQREWVVRLSEEIRTEKAYFITCTIAPEYLDTLPIDWHDVPNAVAKDAIRHFLERVRKKTGKSLRHWFVTELGEDFDRIHIHGFIFGENAAELLREKWLYGYVFIGNYCTEKTIRYCTKYMLKLDEKHKDFTSQVFCSAGIGSNYIKRADAYNNRFQGENTKQTYRTRQGTILALPEYYKRKIYTEDEKEKLWLQMQEKGETYVMGEKCDIESPEYLQLIKYYQQKCMQIHGDNPSNWELQKYVNKLRKMRSARLKAVKKLKK